MCLHHVFHFHACKRFGKWVEALNASSSSAHTYKNGLKQSNASAQAFRISISKESKK